MPLAYVASLAHYGHYIMSLAEVEKGPFLGGEAAAHRSSLRAVDDVRAELQANPERIRGKRPEVVLYADQYVKVSQVRREKNPVTDEMRESILENDLHYPLIVARLSEETFAEYIEFTNELWEADATIEEFAHQKIDGWYYLIVDGHTRHAVISQIEEDGLEERRPILAFVHEVETPDEIILRQMQANLQSRTPREREAAGIVEAYQWGLRHGKWKDEKGFLKIHNKVSKGVFTGALAFSKLPVPIRTYVYKRKMSYNAGIELGKMADTVWEHTVVKCGLSGKKLTPAQKRKVKEIYTEEMLVLAKQILNKRLNSTAAAARLQAQERGYQEEIDEALSGPDSMSDDNALISLGLVTHEEQLEMHARNVRQRLEEVLRENTRRPGAVAIEVLELDKEFLPPSLYADLLADAESSLKVATSKLGGHAAKKSEVVTQPSLID